MVDVHRRVRLPSLVQPIHDALEHRLLLGTVVRPPVVELWSAIVDSDCAEEILETVLGQREAFQVEVHITV